MNLYIAGILFSFDDAAIKLYRASVIKLIWLRCPQQFSDGFWSVGLSEEPPYVFIRNI